MMILQDDKAHGLLVEKVVRHLKKRPLSSPIETGKKIVQDFNADNKDISFVNSQGGQYNCETSLALFDLSKVDFLMKKIQGLHERMDQVFLENSQIYNAFYHKSLTTPMVNEEGYWDLSAYVKTILYSLEVTSNKKRNSINVAALFKAYEELLNSFILSSSIQYALPGYDKPVGVSIFFPQLTANINTFNSYFDFYSTKKEIKAYQFEKHIKAVWENVYANKFLYLKFLVEKALEGEKIKVRISDRFDYNEYFLFVLMYNACVEKISRGEKESVSSYLVFLKNKTYQSSQFENHKADIENLLARE